MSVVTDVLLCTAIEDGSTKECEHPNADALSKYLVSRYGQRCALVKIDGYAGGNKAMQADVFGVAVNYCDIDGLLKAFNAIEWEFPESAVLLLKHEEWDCFRLFNASANLQISGTTAAKENH